MTEVTDLDDPERIRDLLLRASDGVEPLEPNPVGLVRRRLRLKRWERLTFSCALVVVVTVAVVVPLVFSSSSSMNSNPPLAVHVPSLLLRELWNIGENAAIADGDPEASPREAVGPVPYDKTDVFEGGGPLNVTTPVYLVELGGNFGCHMCSPPAGPVDGQALNLLLFAASLKTAGTGIEPHWQSLSIVGTPFTLPKPPNGEHWQVPAGSPGSPNLSQGGSQSASVSTLPPKTDSSEGGSG